ncbi:MAG: hypothetical protein N2049_05785 [Anaerolineales bacterium]|nr:hypothetical protein [Anaerolineales bacterium]MCX7608711.1 hypothetical protein [Anaerolineales bacterium]
MNLLELSLRTTDDYALGLNQDKFVVDRSWPGRMGEFLAVLKRKGIELKFIVTHFHMDHTRLVLNINNLSATPHLLSTQVSHARKPADLLWPKLGILLKMPQDGKLRLTSPKVALACPALGPAGEIPPLAAHSPDHVPSSLPTAGLSSATYRYRTFLIPCSPNSKPLRVESHQPPINHL